MIVTGMGKAGLIGQKIAATLASTGTRSHFLHPAEAVHGDLGRIHQRRRACWCSRKAARPKRSCGCCRRCATSACRSSRSPAGRTSTLGRAATVTIELGPLQEACSLGLAPSTSTTAMLAVGDALALVTSRMRDFRREDFARFHPAGNLGRQLSKVEDHMRPLGRMPRGAANRRPCARCSPSAAAAGAAPARSC